MGVWIMTIAAILCGKGRAIISIDPGSSLQQAAALLAERRIGCVPVIEEGEVVGMLSERDIVRAVGEYGPDAFNRSVRELMTSQVIAITSDLPVISALSLMTQRRIRHLPVVEGGELIGFISIGDLVKYRIDRIEAEAAAMRDYIQSA